MPDAPGSVLPLPGAGGFPVSPGSVLPTPEGAGSPGTPGSVLPTPEGAGSPGTPGSVLPTPEGAGSPESPGSVLETPDDAGSPASPGGVLATPDDAGTPTSPGGVLGTAASGPWQILTDGLDGITGGTPAMREAGTVSGKTAWSNDGVTVIGEETTYPRMQAVWDDSEPYWVLTYAPDGTGANDKQWTSTEDVERPDLVEVWDPPSGVTALPVMRRVPIVTKPWAVIPGPNGWANRLALGDADLTLDGADLTLGPE